MTHIDAGFSTSLGRFSSKWSTNGSAFHLEISTPKGTTGRVAVPLPGNSTSAIITGAGREGEIVHADESGWYAIEGIAGGDYTFVMVGQ